MAVPWLRVLDAVVGLTEVARKANRRPSAGVGETTAAGTLQSVPGPAGGAIEARLTGVVVAALKEAFDRDHQRLQLERDQREAERQRADRLLRLELLRQAGDREIVRLRWLAGVSVATWFAALLFAATVNLATTGTRVAFGVGWALCLAALATAFVAQSHVGAALSRAHETSDNLSAPSGGGAAVAAGWLLVAGLAAIAVGVLVR